MDFIKRLHKAKQSPSVDVAVGFEEYISYVSDVSLGARALEFIHFSYQVLSLGQRQANCTFLDRSNSF